MGVGEDRDKLRYGVVGVYPVQQSVFVRPPYAVVFGANLHPHRVYGVGLQYAYVHHHEPLSVADGKRVGLKATYQLFGLLAEQHERVGFHHKIEALREVMFPCKAQRILLLGGEGVCHLQRVGCGLQVKTVGTRTAVAPRQHHHHQQHGQETTEIFSRHRRSFDSYYKQTPGGNAFRRQAQGRAVRAMWACCPLGAHMLPGYNASSDDTA